MRKSSEVYRELFGLDSTDPRKAQEALQIALDTRKFEIGLYWQRTAFFWALITVAFAGFFAVLAAEKIPDQLFYAFIIACIGFLFSVAWFLVNRGSKYWQENWENHVDVLADGIAGPIYRALLSRADAKGEDWSELIIGPGPVSVSKVNQWVSVFIISIWLLLALSVATQQNFSVLVVSKHLIVVAVSTTFTYLLATKTRTHRGEHRHDLTLKHSHIIGEIDPALFEQPHAFRDMSDQ